MRPGIDTRRDKYKKKETQSENEDGYEIIRCTYDQTHSFKTWIFSLYFGGNRVRLFFLAISTTMFDVDRNSVKYAIHTNNHTQSTNYVLVKY